MMPESRSILVVEDEDTWLDLCVAILAKDGFQVAAAATGAEALARLKTQPFDLVLTDHVAPPAPFASMIEAVKAACPNAEVIAMTADPKVEGAVAAFHQGAADYLPKPFSIDRLRAAVDNCLKKRRRMGVEGLELLEGLVEEKLRKVLGSAGAKPEVVSAFNRLLVDYKASLPLERTQPLYDPAANKLSTASLGRYLILRELGAGAMGQVFLGRDPRINRLVALKTFPPGLADEESRRRFFREAECAGRLAHPHIVKIFDVGEEKGAAFIAMEYLEGRDLRQATCSESLLPPQKALAYAAQAARALGYAHRQGVVHRDIKPANLMIVDADQSLRIMDFGIACLKDAPEATVGVVGTPFYMSPERVAGAPVDGRADLFSLGVVLFELMAGQRPWRNEVSIPSVLHEVANEPHRPLLEVRPDLPAALSAVVDKALAKSRDARYQTGEEFALDLERVSL